jgi:hypothetical protein
LHLLRLILLNSFLESEAWHTINSDCTLKIFKKTNFIKKWGCKKMIFSSKKWNFHEKVEILAKNRFYWKKHPPKTPVLLLRVGSIHIYRKLSKFCVFFVFFRPVSRALLSSPAPSPAPRRILSKKSSVKSYSRIETAKSY